MSEVVDFQTVVVPMSASMWRATRQLRGHTNHGTRECPQRTEPLTLPIDATACAPCSELHHEALLQAHRALSRELATGRSTIEEIRGRASRLSHARFVNWTIDATRKLAGEERMCTRVDRLPETQWFRSALPDPLDRELVCDLLYFVRSTDTAPATDVFPVERWARRHSSPALPLTPNDVRRRIASALEALTAANPVFVVDNIERPLSRRDAAESGDDALRAAEASSVRSSL